jgi:peptidoglycan/LPS O-acetylase OafA/YrhL
MSVVLESGRAAAPSQAYRADIDGLRGVAVLAVLAFHAFPEWFASGFIGVDIFFVISGFLISSIILSDIAVGRFTYRTFYARRVRRIFPALFVVLAACVVVGWGYLLPDEFLSLGAQVFGGATFAANLVLWQQSGYFDQGADLKPLLHLWSLGVEEQFYIAWPALLAFAVRSRRLLAVIGTYALASLALNIAFIGRSPDATFYLPVSRLWELVIGAVVAWYVRERGPVLTGPEAEPRLSLWLGLAGAAALAAGFALIDETRGFPGWWALLPTAGTAFVIAAGPTGWFNRVLAARWLVALGLVSYPLYLWHWPLFVYQRILSPEPASVVARASLAGLAILLAAATYQYVERPLRFRRHRMLVPSLCGAVAMLAVAGWLASTGSLSPRSARGELAHIWAAQADWEPFAGFSDETYMGVRLRTIASDGRGDSRVLFFGDSNIEQFAPRIARLAREEPSRFKGAVVAAVGGCPPVPGIRERHHPGCATFIDDSLALAESDRIDRLVVGACWSCYLLQDMGDDKRFTYYYDDDGQARLLGSGSDGNEHALGALQRMLQRLAGRKPTYLLLSIPFGAAADPKQMVDRGLWTWGPSLRPTALERSAVLREYGELRRRLVQVGRGAGAQVIDPFDDLCPGANCPVRTADGRPIYKDAVHLRPFFVREHASFIDEALMH